MSPTFISNSQEITVLLFSGGRFDNLLVLVQCGLSSEETSMIAGSIKAMQCLVKSFSVLISERLPELMHRALEIAKTQREAMAGSTELKILFDFLASSIDALPVAQVVHAVPNILEMLLEWEVPMRKARNQAKSLLQHLCEVAGFSEVEKHTPEQYGHVLRNLRKLHRRSESQMHLSEAETQMEGAGGSRKTITDKLGGTKASEPGKSEHKSLLSQRSMPRGQPSNTNPGRCVISIRTGLCTVLRSSSQHGSCLSHCCAKGTRQ